MQIETDGHMRIIAEELGMMRAEIKARFVERACNQRGIINRVKDANAQVASVGKPQTRAISSRRL